MENKKIRSQRGKWWKAAIAVWRGMVVLPRGGGKWGCYKYGQTFENIIAHRGHYSGRLNWDIYYRA